MFGKKKDTKTLNATAVIELTERNVEFLRLIQMNQPIPEGAKYIAFLEDGDACFLGDELRGNGPFGTTPMPQFRTITFHTNVPIEFEEE